MGSKIIWLPHIIKNKERANLQAIQGDSRNLYQKYCWKKRGKASRVIGASSRLLGGGRAAGSSQREKLFAGNSERLINCTTGEDAATDRQLPIVIARKPWGYVEASTAADAEKWRYF